MLKLLCWFDCYAGFSNCVAGKLCSFPLFGSERIVHLAQSSCFSSTFTVISWPLAPVQIHSSPSVTLS